MILEPRAGHERSVLKEGIFRGNARAVDLVGDPEIRALTANAAAVRIPARNEAVEDSPIDTGGVEPVVAAPDAAVSHVDERIVSDRHNIVRGRRVLVAED